MSININDKYVQATEVVSCDLENGRALLDLEAGEYFKLNKTAGLLWDWMSNPAKANELVEKMTDIFDVDSARCEADVLGVMRSFYKANLIVLFDEQSD